MRIDTRPRYMPTHPYIRVSWGMTSDWGWHSQSVSQFLLVDDQIMGIGHTILFYYTSLLGASIIPGSGQMTVNLSGQMECCHVRHIMIRNSGIYVDIQAKLWIDLRAVYIGARSMSSRCVLLACKDHHFQVMTSVLRKSAFNSNGRWRVSISKSATQTSALWSDFEELKRARSRVEVRGCWEERTGPKYWWVTWAKRAMVRNARYQLLHLALFVGFPELLSLSLTNHFPPSLAHALRLDHRYHLSA